MTAKSTRKPGTRSAEATRARIVAAAKIEFAKNGLSGARVDVIAERFKANKRMIYHYFNSKEGLFQTALEDAYVDIRTAEQDSQRFVRESRQATSVPASTRSSSISPSPRSAITT